MGSNSCKASIECFNGYEASVVCLSVGDGGPGYWMDLLFLVAKPLASDVILAVVPRQVVVEQGDGRIGVVLNPLQSRPVDNGNSCYCLLTSFLNHFLDPRKQFWCNFFTAFVDPRKIGSFVIACVMFETIYCHKKLLGVLLSEWLKLHAQSTADVCSMYL